MSGKSLMARNKENKKDNTPLTIVGQEAIYSTDLKKMGKKKKAALTNQVRVSAGCLEKVNILSQILGYGRSNELIEALLDERIDKLTEDEQDLYSMAKKVYNIPKR